jgi:hypothetical protein
MRVNGSSIMSTIPRIRVADVHKRFGPLEVLRGVSFDVYSGNYSYVSVEQIGGEFWQAVRLTLSPAILDPNILPLSQSVQVRLRHAWPGRLGH